MSVLEIVIVVIVGLTLILPGLFIERFKLKNQLKVKTKSQRITVLASAFLMLCIVWLLAPPGPLFPKVGMTVLMLISIFTTLDGWLFNVKVKS